MPAWLVSLFAAIPGLVKLALRLLPTKEERAQKRREKLEKKRRLEESELGSASDKAREEGDNSGLEDIINRKR